MTRYRLVLTCLLVFAVALALRLIGLGSFLTPDENLWATRTTQFLTALSANDWAGTYVTGHPGVTTMWAGSLGLIAKWLFARSPTAPNFLASVSELAADPVRLDYLPWLRLPVALASAAAIVVIYLLARQLMVGAGASPAPASGVSRGTAPRRRAMPLLAAGLLVFDPFLLAHGRLLQMDGLLAAWIAIAWLALVVALRTGQRRFYLLSGLSIGLAVLTKSPALVMGPLMLGAIVLARMRQQGPLRARLSRIAGDLLWTGIPAAIIIFLLWPALWVEPLATLSGVWELMTAYGGGEHELGSYWLGKPVAEPSMLFYPVALVLRLTPATSIGLLLALAVLFLDRGKREMDVGKENGEGKPFLPPVDASTRRLAGWALLAFALWFGIMMTLGAKKFDRYLLPIFPAVDLLAAFGWMSVFSWAAARLWRHGSPGGRSGLRPSPSPSRLSAASFALLAGPVLLVAIQAWSALAERPSYLTAYNPLAGGIRAAARILLVGWGEGLEETAAYLNQLTGARGGHVAAWYGTNVFGAFYRATSFDLYYDTPVASDLYARDVDWVVTYLNQEQRDLVDPSIATQLDAPLYTVARNGVTLASVYAWPKPFAHTTDQPIGEGLRLLGWQVDDHDRSEGTLPVTLYWDATEATAAARAAQHVVIWLKDAAGEVWATAEETLETDSLPASAALVEARWPSRPVVAQSFMLHPPIGLSPGVYRIEIAPFAGDSTGLTDLEVEATSLSDVGARRPGAASGVSRGKVDVPSLGPRIVIPPGEVRFGDVARLIGSSLNTQGESWTVDLVWTWPTPAAQGEPYHYFIHIVDADERIIAQQDGPLAQARGADELARQRIHLALPGGIPSAYRVYAGIYRSADGARVPLAINGQPVPDGRYLLAAED